MYFFLILSHLHFENKIQQHLPVVSFIRILSPSLIVKHLLAIQWTVFGKNISLSQPRLWDVLAVWIRQDLFLSSHQHQQYEACSVWNFSKHWPKTLSSFETSGELRADKENDASKNEKRIESVSWCTQSLLPWSCKSTQAEWTWGCLRTFLVNFQGFQGWRVHSHFWQPPPIFSHPHMKSFFVLV